MSPTPDQLNTAIIGVASLTVASLSFIYASKAQKATREAEAARERGAEIAVDAQAYLRARDLYEGSIKTLTGQNDALRAEVDRLRADHDQATRHAQEMDARVAALERLLRGHHLDIPPWEGGSPA